jgi:CubicO group peptidase (beta-lactamase class C family)
MRLQTSKTRDIRRIGHLAILVICAAVGCRTIDDRLNTAATPRDIARAVADYYVQDADDESCSVAIVHSNGVVFASAGSADEHALFRIASLSKLFLHPVLLKLHDEGRINLDRPVSSVSKLDLPPEYGCITLRDLLLNRSGLPREFIVRWEPFDMLAAFSCGFFGTHIYSAFDTRESFAKMTWRPWWRHAVKARRELYSNMGFGLLGTAVEDELGMTLEEILRQELTTPLDLADTAYDPQGEQTNRLTRACAGHLPWLVRRRHDVPDHRLGDALRATGGLFSSAADCAKVFSSYWPVIDEQMRERDISAYADDAVFGLLRVKVLSSGRRILYRSGMIYGGASFVGFDPETRTIVVILRNVTSWPDNRGFAVMEKLLKTGAR